MNYTARVVPSLASLERDQWDLLDTADNPFLSYDFLEGLEQTGSIGPDSGWHPYHLAVFDGDQLLACAPTYAKDNSHGEFVFDWAWADAYQRNGLHYYPKAVAAVPYTPATGPRLLIAAGADRQLLSARLIELAEECCRAERLSSLHWLFTDPLDTQALEQAGLMLRLGCQFHWRNRGYRDFDDYLDSFSSRKRKKVRRERRYVREQDIELRVVHGHEASDEQLRVMSEFYRTTFEKKWGYPTLNLAFFRDLAASMGEQLVFFIAYRQRTIVAGAICLRSDDTLYGRHWGCYQDYHSLHCLLYTSPSPRDHG